MQERISIARRAKLVVVAFSVAASLASLYGQAARSRPPAAAKLPVASSAPADSSNSEIAPIIQLIQGGFSEELIVKTVQRAGKVYNLSPADMLRLKKEGASEKVIAAMLEPSPGPAPATASVPAKGEPPVGIAAPVPAATGSAEPPPGKSGQEKEKKNDGGWFKRLRQSAQDTASNTVQTSLDSANTRLQNSQDKINAKIQNGVTPGQANGAASPSTSQPNTPAARATPTAAQPPTAPAAPTVSNPATSTLVPLGGTFKCSNGATLVLSGTGNQVMAVVNPGVPGKSVQTFSGTRNGSAVTMAGATGSLQGSASNSSVRLVAVSAGGTRQSFGSCTPVN